MVHPAMNTISEMKTGDLSCRTVTALPQHFGSSGMPTLVGEKTGVRREPISPLRLLAEVSGVVSQAKIPSTPSNAMSHGSTLAPNVGLEPTTLRLRVSLLYRTS